MYAVLGAERKRRRILSEAPVVKRVMMEASKLGFRLLRNNRGLFKSLDGKRHVRAGLEATGASDTIGIYTIIVTQEMVGMELGLALVAEAKEPDWKETKKFNEHEEEQQGFIDQVEKRGGIGFFINNHELLEKKIADSLKKKIDAHKKV